MACSALRGKTDVAPELEMSMMKALFLIIVLWFVSGCGKIDPSLEVTGVEPVSMELSDAGRERISWSEVRTGVAIGILPLPAVIKRGEPLIVDFYLSNQGEDIFYVVPAAVSDVNDVLQAEMVGPTGPVKYTGKRYAHILNLDVLASKQIKAYRIRLLPKCWDVSIPGCYSLSLVYQVAPNVKDNRNIWCGSLVTPVCSFVVSE